MSWKDGIRDKNGYWDWKATEKAMMQERREQRRAEALADAQAWRSEHPAEWEKWLSACRLVAKNGFSFTLRSVIETDCGFAPYFGCWVDDIWPLMVAAEHPELRGFIELRESEFCEHFPAAFEAVER